MPGRAWRARSGGRRFARMSEMAAAERLDHGYLGGLLRLTLLAPEIVETILDGRQQADLGLPNLMEAFPTDWVEQKAAWFSSVSRMPAGLPTPS